MQNIRNFAIIAHIDHGKSTLADRLLEITGTVAKRDMQEQLLDSNPIERERGITIKLAPVRMNYTLNANHYILNLIDTPGHVDFAYEVSRSLAACEGVVLLVDATQGIQAQTLAHFNHAKKLGLTIIPVINKIDISTADIEGAKRQISEILNLDLDSVLLVSGKTGVGVPELLEAIIDKIPSPKSEDPKSTRALVFNSNFDSHLGVIAWVRVVDGVIATGDKIRLVGTGAIASIVEVGVFAPTKKSIGRLAAGEVGYLVTNLKDITQLTVGDTIVNCKLKIVNSLPGYAPVNPVVFISLYPIDGAEINNLRDALGKLKLQDGALSYAAEFSPALGNGFRIGCLGLLHADIIQERLEREFGLALLACAPSVGYEIVLHTGGVVRLSKASDLPDPASITELREPLIKLEILVPEDYLGAVMQLAQNHRAAMQDMQYLGKQVHLTYTMPFVELIRGFYDQLKSASAGFATLDYELQGFAAADLAKLDILVADERVDAFSQIVPRAQAPYIGRELVAKIADIIPRQAFEVAVQAAIGGKVLARADIKAYRKDVLAKMSGGDQTRKDKLLEKQKKGKARMKRVGRVDIPQEAFLAVLKV